MSLDQSSSISIKRVCTIVGVSAYGARFPEHKSLGEAAKNMNPISAKDLACASVVQVVPVALCVLPTSPPIRGVKTIEAL